MTCVDHLAHCNRKSCPRSETAVFFYFFIFPRVLIHCVISAAYTRSPWASCSLWSRLVFMVRMEHMLSHLWWWRLISTTTL